MSRDPTDCTEHRIPIGGDLRTILTFLQQHGTDVALTYREDTEQWACSWTPWQGSRAVRLAGDPADAASTCMLAGVGR